MNSCHFTVTLVKMELPKLEANIKESDEKNQQIL